MTNSAEVKPNRRQRERLFVILMNVAAVILTAFALLEVMTAESVGSGWNLIILPGWTLTMLFNVVFGGNPHGGSGPEWLGIAGIVIGNMALVSLVACLCVWLTRRMTFRTGRQ